MRARVDHPFRVSKQQSGFQKTRLSGMGKNQGTVMVLAALTHLFLARKRLREMAIAETPLPQRFHRGME